MNYYINKTIRAGFDEAVEMVTEALKEKGFGILSEIDISEKMREKMDIEFRKYKILGACNPPFAYKALQHEDKVGTLLPCNVIVQEVGDQLVEVAAVDPVASMVSISNPGLTRIAEEVRDIFEEMIEEL
ncbi:MAG: DUF302 domain-containing protein [Bacteroidales bacterium]|nr:DUF302 domain-containing protein [Bacteroidales bacterium]MDT8430596.1 DUF302 domain-containing protein [Bacteroidales bacterium]